MALEQSAFRRTMPKQRGYTPTKRSLTPSIKSRPNIGCPATYSWGQTNLRPPKRGGGYNIGNLGGLLGGRGGMAGFSHEDYERQR